VQAQLRRNQLQAKRNRKQDYLLSGHLFCGQCGKKMSAHGSPHRRYRCSTFAYLPPNERCHNSIRADEAEGRVWEAIEKFLKNPELIADKVAQQQATAAEQLAHLQQQMAAIDGALAKCDREEQRWREAYAAEVISLEEFKGFRGNIAATRQALHAEQRQFKAEMSAVQLMNAHAEAIVAYCARVHAELKAFDMAGKRDALEWFEARATLAPDKSIDLEITLDSTEIVYLAP
jgi:site-specific DNA recombinase